MKIFTNTVKRVKTKSVYNGKVVETEKKIIPAKGIQYKFTCDNDKLSKTTFFIALAIPF